jgi:hypothetical protein
VDTIIWDLTVISVKLYESISFSVGDSVSDEKRELWSIKTRWELMSKRDVFNRALQRALNRLS